MGIDNCSPVCKCIRAHCNCMLCKPTVVVFTSVCSVHAPARFCCPQSRTARLHACRRIVSLNAALLRAWIEQSSGFLMRFNFATLELTQLWSERRWPGFSKVSVYTSVVEDRKRKFTVLVDMQIHQWLRNKKKTLPLLFSEQTQINSKRGIIYHISIIN